MSESVIICAIICLTIVMVTWIASLSMAKEENVKEIDDSDKLKYMMCGEALQNSICNQKCYKCAWNVKKEEVNELREE